MRSHSIEDKLKKILKRLFKKDRVMYEILMKKIEEIINCENIDHYKNLRKPKQQFKRVHVRSSFVLIFTFKNNKISFYDFDHHDKIYNKK